LICNVGVVVLQRMVDLNTSFLLAWQRKLVVFARRQEWITVLTWGAGIGALVMALATWQILSNEGVLSALSGVVLLFANLVPAVMLLVLGGRRLAMRRAEKSLVGANGRLHVRLVALFSLIATVPVVLMVLVASLLFQYGVDIWYSKRAQGMFENTTALAQQLYAEKQKRVMDETAVMAGDLVQALQVAPIDSQPFANQFAFQVYQRELSEAAVLAISTKNGVQTLAIVNPYERSTQNWVPPEVARELLTKRQAVFRDTGSRMESVTPMPGTPDLFLYASRVADTETLAQAKRASLVLKDYNALLKRSGTLQFRLNAALYLLSLLIIGMAVWIALRVADRLVRPVGELVDAARKVAAGDLSVRVSTSRSRDEVGVLSRAFNRMTERLGEQNMDLIASNDLLDRRRVLIEAVLSGVTAGVISATPDGHVRVINRSACEILKIAPGDVVGASLKELVPDFAALLEEGRSETVLQLGGAGETRTLAVKVVESEFGHILTFDDITQQLIDQRRAAWSDVARRVAHEIKNPLTPIQLAAERLKRRFSKEIVTDQAAFDRLTDTIVRQVGDLRRMVDEFSSFARMPKPEFAEEPIVDISREAMFLHEVANPSIRFSISAPSPSPMLVCDRRQLAQALSNIVKNGVEAIGQRKDAVDPDIAMTLTAEPDGAVSIRVADAGIGLPLERDRIIEPYMTTRPGGTGLGLAIVKKIIEEHMGTISFADREGGGTVVTIRIDPAILAAAIARQANAASPAADQLPSALTRHKEN
jgi:two-component system nitrogen regulation sensor histidine kinase NtrY